MSTNLRRAPTDNDRFGYSHLWNEAGLGHIYNIYNTLCFPFLFLILSYALFICYMIKRTKFNRSQDENAS